MAQIEGYGALPLIRDEVPSAHDWVFCIGLARSGSTALCRLVSRHRDALLLNESGLFVHSMLLRSQSIRIVSGQSIHNTQLARTVGGGIPASLIRGWMEQVRQQLPGRPRLFGDKLGAYAWCLEDLLAVFPGCRLVAAERDVWDAVASFMDLPWYRQRHSDMPGPQLAERTFAICSAARERLAQIRQEHDVFSVDFEQMAVNPQTVLRNLFEFLGLPSTDAAYDYDQAIADTHYGGSIGRWQRVPEVVELRQRIETDLAPPVRGREVAMEDTSHVR